MDSLIKIGDLVDYGSMICDVTVVAGDILVIRKVNSKSIYKVRLSEIILYKRVNKTPDFCFVCGNKLKEFGLGIKNCSDKKCDSIFLPFIDENGNQNLMLGEDKDNIISYDLPKRK